MKFDPGQRRLYVLALIVLVCAIAILCIWFLWLRDGGEEEPAPYDRGGYSVSTQLPDVSAAPVSSVQKPFSRSIPWCIIRTTTATLCR